MKNSKVRGNEYREDLDQYAQEYIQPNTPRNIDQKFMTLLIDRAIKLIEGPDVLEMGFGDGLWTGRLIQIFGKSHVVDASSRLLERAKALYHNKIFTYVSYFEEFIPSCLFDTVICTYVLEHIVDPVAVLNKIKSWLKPGGLLFVAVPNATSLHRRLGVLMGLLTSVYELNESDISVGHRRVYDAEKLEADIKSAGFRIEKSMPTMCKPLTNSLLSQLNEDQLKGLFDLGDQIPADQRGILTYLCRPARKS